VILTEPTYKSALKWSLGTVLTVLVKFPLVLIVCAWIVLASALSELFFFVPQLRRVLKRLLIPLAVRLLLLLLGFYFIESKWVSLKRGKALKNYADVWPRGRTISHGDLLICNHVSYVDLLYLYFRFNPVFTSVCIEADDTYYLTNVSLIGALWNIINPSKKTSADTFKDIRSIIEYAKVNKFGPVIVFPEGSTSNGRGLLKFIAPIVQEIFESSISFHLVGFKYHYESYSPSYTVGSLPLHLFQLCNQLYNTLEVRYLVPDDSNEIKTYDALVEAFSTILRVPKTAISYEDKIDFVAYYVARSNGTLRKKND
jgi:hypothetical protein